MINKSHMCIRKDIDDMEIPVRSSTWLVVPYQLAQVRKSYVREVQALNIIVLVDKCQGQFLT